MMNNKRGSVRDVVLIMFILLGLGVAVFGVHFMFNTTVNQMLGITAINSSDATVTALQSSQTISNRFDYIIFGTFIGLILALMISSWFIGGHPIFMGIYFLVVIITVSISPVVSNMWDDIAQASIWGGNVANFPLTNHILSYLPIYMSVIGLLGLLIMFSKPFLSEGGY